MALEKLQGGLYREVEAGIGGFCEGEGFLGGVAFEEDVGFSGFPGDDRLEIDDGMRELRAVGRAEGFFHASLPQDDVGSGGGVHDVIYRFGQYRQRFGGFPAWRDFPGIDAGGGSRSK